LDDAGGFGVFFWGLDIVAGPVFVGFDFARVAKSSRLAFLPVLLRVVTIVSSDSGYFDYEFSLEYGGDGREVGGINSPHSLII